MQDRLAVGLNSFDLALEVLEQHAQSEIEDGARVTCVSVQLFGLFEQTVRVQKAAQVDSGPQVRAVQAS